MTEFFVLLNQVLVLFVLMGIGYILKKKEKLTQAGIDQMTFLVLYIVMPCIIFYSFQKEFDPQMMDNLLITLAVATAIHVGFVALSHLIFNGRFIPDDYQKNCLRFGAIYCNCAFMGFPLLSTILGSEGVFLGSAYNGIFALFIWTHGLLLYLRRFDFRSLLKAFLNPNIIATLLGMIFFCFSLQLPTAVMLSLRFVSEINTGLSMIIIGTIMTQLPLNTLFSNWKIWFSVLLRNLIFPIAAVYICFLCGLRGNLLLTEAVLSACPTAGMAVLFAALTDKDTVYPSKVMMLSTLLSLVTVPVVIMFAKVLLG